MIARLPRDWPLGLSCLLFIRQLLAHNALTPDGNMNFSF
jgi:hypothetical protein